jgi:hypothetical protein
MPILATNLIQKRLTTTVTKLNYFRPTVNQIIACNDHAADAVIVKVFTIPSSAAKAGASAQHLLWVQTVAASSTEIFEPRSGVVIPDTFEIHASASADSKVTLTLVA